MLGRNRAEELGLVGQTIAGKYKVLEVLGQGGFGTVFLVEIVAGMVGQKLAMKVLPREFCRNALLRGQFLNEIRVAMKMVNKYIVQIRDVGDTEDGLLYYTMDYIAGRSLAQILREELKLSVVRTLRIALRVLHAIDTAHGAGIIHRDLKPGNIMIQEENGKETARVLDFGIATALGKEPAEQKGFAGSPYYMPPEQFLGTEMGFYTDLYAVGVILYECITGQKPYRGSTPQEIYNNIKRSPPQPVEEMAPEVLAFPGLAEMLMRALERNPEKRFQSAKEFFEQVTAILSRGPNPTAAAPAPARAEPPGAAAAEPLAPRRPLRRRGRVRVRRPAVPTAAFVAAFLLLSGLGAILILRDPTEGRSSSPAEAPRGGTLEAVSMAGESGTAAAPDWEAETESGSKILAEVQPNPAPPAGSEGTTEAVQVRGFQQHLEDAEKALAEEKWARARDLASKVLQVEQDSLRARRIAGSAHFGLGEFQRAIEELEAVKNRLGQEATDAALYLQLAEAYGRLATPQWDQVEQYYLRVRDLKPREPEPVLALARLYEKLAAPDKLKSLLIEAHARNVTHPEIAKLHEEIVVAGERREREEIAKLQAESRQAFAEGDCRTAQKKAAEAGARLELCDLQLIILECAARRGELQTSQLALEKLAKMVEAGKCDSVPEVYRGEGLPLPLLLEYFAGRSAYLRHLRNKDKKLLQAAKEKLTVFLDQIDPRSAPEHFVLARTYRGSVYAAASDDLHAVEKEFEAAKSDTQAEVIYLQAKAYFDVGEKFEKPRDDDEKLARNNRLQELKLEMHNLRVQLNRQGLSPQARADLQKEWDKKEKEYKKLADAKAKRDAADDELKKKNVRAYELSQGRCNTLLRLPSLSDEYRRDGNFLWGRCFLRRAEVEKDQAFLGHAHNRFLEASKNGLESAQLYDEWAQSFALRDRYGEAAAHARSAFEKEPTPARCLVAAEHFLKANQQRAAREVLARGRELLPQNAAIEQKLKEIGR
jgi:hypothetical protein